ncbi:hypothetical protein VI817_009878 [Penicillium citrinum]|nr:hypothetical protein VI817_009878 [Penicillium citrinum]
MAEGGAVITALLAAILHMTLENSTGFYIFLLLLPSIWSLADGLLRLRQVKVPILVNAVLDFFSAAWLLYNGGLTVFGWMWYGSAVLATIALCCFVAVYVPFPSSILIDGF